MIQRRFTASPAIVAASILLILMLTAACGGNPQDPSSEKVGNTPSRGLIEPVAIDSQTSQKFVVFGDMPYEADVEGGKKDSDVLRSEILPGIAARDDILFTIHLGDMGRPEKACDIQFRQDTIDEWKQNFYQNENDIKPMIYTPGDNDWTDCSREPTNADPLERLDELLKMFFDNDLNRYLLDDPEWSLTPQPNQRENLRWTSNKLVATGGTVLFTTVHVVASDNGRGQTPAMDAESDQRENNVLAWLDETYDRAGTDDTKAIVIAAQVDPLKPTDSSPSAWEACRDNPTPFYGKLCEKLRTFNDLKKPVLFIHGDSNAYCLDQPIPTEDMGENYIWRLNAPGDFKEIDAAVIEINLRDDQAPFKVEGLLSHFPPPTSCDYSRNTEPAPAYPQ